MAMRLVTLLSGILSVSQADNFESIKNYELVQLTLDQSNAAGPLLKFHAFSQDFEVELERNDDLIPAGIRHTNGHPSMVEGGEQIVTHLTESCHFFAAVLSHDDQTPAQGAVSLCGKRGIRATLHIGSDTLYIRPAAVYLDTEREHHSFDDEYIVYYERDVDRPEINYGDSMPSPLDKLRSNVQSQVDGAMDAQTEQEEMTAMDGERRRMLYNNGLSQVEVLMILDPTIIKYFQGKYSNWYEQLTAQMLDTINEVSAVYVNNGGLGWDSNINSIRVKIVEFLWVFQWSGNYLSLEPAEKCSDYTSCQIDGSAWLNKIQVWIDSYKKNERTEFDNVMVLHNINMGGPGTAGWGWKGTMCGGGWSASDNYMIYEAFDILFKTVAHELGHNFGMSHDQDVGCGMNGGLMGYGSSKPNSFSSCSQSAIVKGYADNNGYTCLSDSPPSTYRTNYDPTGGSGVTTTTTTTTTTTYNPATTTSTTRYTTTSTTSGSSGSWSCVVASGHSNAALNGFWTATGQTNSGQPVYTKDGMYLYSLWNVYWAFGTSVGSSSVVSYCSGAALASCSGGMFSGGESFSSCDDSSSPSSTISSTVSGCQYFSCLQIAGLNQDINGYDFNGQWSPKGCNSGKAYYTKVVGTRLMYFYRQSSGGYWMISSTLDSASGNAYCWADNVEDCGNNMYVYTSSGMVMDTTSMIFDCGGGAPFTGADTACLGSRGYSEELCLYHNNSDNSLWTGYSPFSLYNLCVNDQPVYTYSAFNKTANMTVTFYLHFDEYYKYSDDNETSPRWIISRREISTNGEAVCEEENLLNCIEDKWVVRARSSGPTDGFMQRVTEKTLTVNNEQCEAELDAEPKKNNTAGIVVVIVCVLVLVACIVGGYCFWKKSNRDLKREIHGTINGGKTKKTAEGGYAETAEDIDVEVSVERDANNTTVTND